MNLVKTTIAAALTITLSQPALANPLKSKELTLYGKANISFQSSDEGEGSFTEVQSNSSRIGVKGAYALKHNLEAIYQFEWQVNVDDSNKDSLTSRNQWVGLRGNFGELTVGRADTSLKVSQGKFDLFNDYEGDIKHLFPGEFRASDSVTYKSPKYQHLQLLASYIVSEDHAKSDPIAYAVHYGDMSLKKTDFFISYAHDEEVSGLDDTRITGMYKFADLRLGLMWQESESHETGKSENGYASNISYQFGDLLVKAQYQEFVDADVISFGLDYKLSKQTKAFAWYTDREEMHFIEINNEDLKSAKAGEYFAVGLEHKF
jgi:predicted porin